MNKKLGLAVASALLAASASANAGIIIPAGDWTLDINGNVNTYMSSTSVDKGETISGDGGVAGGVKGEKKGIGTGLLPAWIGFTGKTRQNDLDVEFTISMQPGSSDNGYHGDGSNGSAGTGGGVRQTFLNRQTYVKFGDASWGSIKLGKDLGIYASDAILNDMTLLGVGGAGHLQSGSAINTTTGGIGTGYQYAAWKGQVAYSSPNWNGFQFTLGLTNPNQFGTDAAVSQSQFGVEGKASYAWTGDAPGKVWASFATYKVDYSKTDAWDAKRISAYDIGANVNFGSLGLTGYYYDGTGNGSTAFGLSGLTTGGKRRDGNGGYVQATYVIPTGTKIGLAYGESNLDRASGEAKTDLIEQNQRWTVGAYHPLTKSLNLVAEYTDIKGEAHNGNKNEYSTIAAGAILFF